MPPPHHHHHLYILQMVKITLVGQPLLKDVFVLFLYLYWYLYLYLYILLLLYLLQVVFVQGDPSTAHCYKLYSRPHPLITLFSVHRQAQIVWFATEFYQLQGGSFVIANPTAKI